MLSPLGTRRDRPRSRRGTRRKAWRRNRRHQGTRPRGTPRRSRARRNIPRADSTSALSLEVHVSHGAVLAGEGNAVVGRILPHSENAAVSSASLGGIATGARSEREDDQQYEILTH